MGEKNGSKKRERKGAEGWGLVNGKSREEDSVFFSKQRKEGFLVQR